MPYQFTSIAHSIEKLLEAEYFLAGIVRNSGYAFQYNLNAYLAACRSISLVLQKSMSSVPEFEAWYDARRKEMRADATMGFFVELRNISLHEGPVSFVGGSISQPPGWTYRFAGNREAVPPILMGQDVACACADHLTKLAKLLKDFAEAFPYNYCIVNALTLEGLNALNYTLRDVEKLLGLPSGYSDVDMPLEAKLRVLSREVDEVDMPSVNRMAGAIFQDAMGLLEFHVQNGADSIDEMARIIESDDPIGKNMRATFIKAVLGRIDAFEQSNEEKG